MCELENCSPTYPFSTKHKNIFSKQFHCTISKLQAQHSKNFIHPLKQPSVKPTLSDPQLIYSTKEQPKPALYSNPSCDYVTSQHTTVAIQRLLIYHSVNRFVVVEWTTQLSFEASVGVIIQEYLKSGGLIISLAFVIVSFSWVLFYFGGILRIKFFGNEESVCAKFYNVVEWEIIYFN